jgi:hypothetical protein
MSNVRKSEGKYKLDFMQKMATVAATADGLSIEGNNFKVGALTGCPDMVLFACESIATLEAEILAMREAKEEDDLNAKEEGIRVIERDEKIANLKTIIVKTAGNILDADDCEQDSDEAGQRWEDLKEFALLTLGRTDT